MAKVNLSPKILISLVILIIITGFNKKTNDCNSLYKSGKFKQFIYNNTTLGHWRAKEFWIERNDSIELNINPNFSPAETTFYKIKWNSANEYKLTFVRSTDSLVDKVFRNSYKKKDQKYKIITCTDKYSIVKSRKYKDTIWVR